MKRACRVEAGKIRYTESADSTETRRRGGRGRGRGGRGGGRILQRRSSTRSSSKRGDIFANNKEHLKLEQLRRKYQNRRNILFKSICPTRAPQARASLRYLDQFWYNEIKYTVGDIVAITDKDDDEKYFAQLRGIVVDSMMNPRAVLTWLVPKLETPDPHEFEAEMFVHGLVDNANYNLNTCEWVCERPDYPIYQATWTPQRASAAHNREMLRARWKALIQLTKEELSKAGVKPLANFIPLKNKEIKQPKIPLIQIDSDSDEVEECLQETEKNKSNN